MPPATDTTVSIPPVLVTEFLPSYYTCSHEFRLSEFEPGLVFGFRPGQVGLTVTRPAKCHLPDELRVQSSLFILLRIFGRRWETTGEF